jgi:hypothetical protein
VAVRRRGWHRHRAWPRTGHRLTTDSICNTINCPDLDVVSAGSVPDVPSLAVHVTDQRIDCVEVIGVSVTVR